MFKFFFLFISFILAAGCATTHEYQGANFPSLHSSSFPSFSPISEIKDPIKIKIPEASGKTKVSMNINLTQGQQHHYITSNMDWGWDINVKDGLIYNNHFMEAVITALGERKHLSMKIDGIHETSGNEIKLDVSFDNMEDELTVEELNQFKNRMSDYINAQFVSLGKSVKTGDILKYIPNEIASLKKTSDPNILAEFPEVIIGLGVYRNKNVVVTEYVMEDSIYNPDFIMEVRGKGYNLYDAETFIQLFGEGTIYTSVFTQREKTMYFKMDMRYEAQDVHVKNIIN